MIPRKFFCVIDAVILGAAFVIAYWLTLVMRPWRETGMHLVHRIGPSLAPSPGTGDLPPIVELLWVLFIVIPTALLTLSTLRAYGSLRHLSRTRLVLTGPLAVTMSLGVATLVIFSLRRLEWSRMLLLTSAVLAAVGLSGFRLARRGYERWRAKSGYYRRTFLAIGRAESIAPLARFITSRLPADEYQFVGYLEASRVVPEPASLRGARAGDLESWSSAGRTEPSPPPHSAQGVDCADLVRLGSARDLTLLLGRRHIDEIVVALSTEEGSWVESVIGACDDAAVPVRIVPEPLLARELTNLRCTRDLMAPPMPAVLYATRDWNKADALYVKRIFDVVVSGALLLLLSPLLLVVMIAVKLSSRGPIFYRWRVIGKHGREFTGYKFRTMVANADELKPALLRHNEMWGPVFKMRRDPRVTPLGRFLRKYSLDELPQLWCVLKGDMSLVGPRPPFRAELEEFEFWQMRKISVRPGITCLWQVNGRNKVSDFADWVRMDLEYIDNWSLWLDVRILVKTVFTVLRGTGA